MQRITYDLVQMFKVPTLTRISKEISETFIAHALRLHEKRFLRYLTQTLNCFIDGNETWHEARSEIQFATCPTYVLFLRRI